ncbi:MAG: DUF2061 domain-containing protein [Rhizobiaceae bacterium]
MTDLTSEYASRDCRPLNMAETPRSNLTLQREKPWRSVAKAITWRIIGTLDTFFLSFIIIKYLGPVFGLMDESSDLEIAATASLIAITEVLTKVMIYTAHERVWNRIDWGVVRGKLIRHETRFRSFAKMSTWRVLASLDTTLLAWLFTGNIATAISIGGIEVITKLALYFVHERLWLQVKLGLQG